MAFQHHRKEQKEVTLTEIRAQTTLPKPKNILNAKDFTIYITPGSPLVTVNACVSFSYRFLFLARFYVLISCVSSIPRLLAKPGPASPGQ